VTAWTIRPYDPPDRQALHRIAADTALFGEPVERFLSDRRLFLDAFYVYYTDLEPAHSWVACVEGKVVGFVVGAIDTVRQQRRWRRQVLPRVVWRALRGRYHLGRSTWRYTARVAHAALRGEFAQPNLVAYPAHLHINVDRQWRGRGIGRGLISAYLGQLRRLGVPGVHLGTTDLNRVACRLYEKTGFQLLDARPTSVWSDLVSHPVEHRIYGLRFGREQT
jgi:ribosomal protein S18 acetylase RimI-like enzyme